jgi:nicotinamidase-related amidase
MKTNRILIAVDLQRDFIDGALGTAEAVAIVPAAAEKIRACRAAGYPVIATLDTHGANYLATREGRFLPVAHCVRDKDGWQLHPEIAAALGDSMRLCKPSFGSMELPERVRALTGTEGEGAGLTIELIGLCTDICVVSNAMILKAAFPEAELTVDAACCAGVTPEKHRAALETMASCQIVITNWEGET